MIAMGKVGKAPMW